MTNKISINAHAAGLTRRVIMTTKREIQHEDQTSEEREPKVSKLSESASPSSTVPSEVNPSDTSSSTLDAPTDPKDQRLTERQQKEEERRAERARKESERLAEKARKEEEKAEEKARKDAEREAEKVRRQEEKDRKKAERDAEKARKDAEREAAKVRKEAEKEAERLRKEAERQRKEDEKEAERLKKETEKEAERLKKEAEKRKDEEGQLKINSFFKIKKTAAPAEPPITEKTSDYNAHFLPFHIKSNVDLYWDNPPTESPADSLEWLRQQRQPEDPQWLSTKQVFDRINYAQESEIQGLLNRLCVRHIEFAENARPPYVGTVPIVEETKLNHLKLDSTLQIVDTVDYEYDSEAEWVQEEDDGEDLGDEDESEGEEEDEDMDEFVVSDEETTRRIQIVGPLTPIIKWNNGSEPELFTSMAFQPLMEGPIDPFKNYWIKPEEPAPSAATESTSASPVKSEPALDFHSTKALLTKVQGRQMNQTLLVEILKQEFPQISKASILHIVRNCAKRQGNKETEKTWVVDPQLCETYSIPSATV